MRLSQLIPNKKAGWQEGRREGTRHRFVFARRQTAGAPRGRTHTFTDAHLQVHVSRHGHVRTLRRPRPAGAPYGRHVAARTIERALQAPTAFSSTTKMVMTTCSPRPARPGAASPHLCGAAWPGCRPSLATPGCGRS
eukprot:364624-Chlamydomonas_euryale.AAC.3